MVGDGSRPITDGPAGVGRRKPSSASMVVVLPAPFGPSTAVICPAAASKVTPSTAVTSP